MISFVGMNIHHREHSSIKMTVYRQPTLLLTLEHPTSYTFLVVRTLYNRTSIITNNKDGKEEEKHVLINLINVKFLLTDLWMKIFPLSSPKFFSRVLVRCCKNNSILCLWICILWGKYGVLQDGGIFWKLNGGGGEGKHHCIYVTYVVCLFSATQHIR